MWKRCLFAVLGMAVAALAPSQAQEGALPPDLAAVHPDAMGFVHVRLADLWKHEALKDLRTMVAKAGPKALAALDEHFAPKPSTADRVTVVLIPTENGPRDLPARFVVVLQFREPFDKDQVQKSFAAQGMPKKAGRYEVLVNESSRSALAIIGPQTLAFSDVETLPDYLTWATKDDGGLAEARKLAVGQKQLFAAVNVARLPLPPADQLPPEFQPLMKMKTLTLSLDIQAQVAIAARAHFPSQASAAEGEKSLYRLAELARMSLADPRRGAEAALYKKEPALRPVDDLPEAMGAVAVLGLIGMAEDFLAHPPLKQNGATLEVDATLPVWATQYLGVASMGVGLMLPAVQKTREAASRNQSANNLKQIALAMHNYESAYGKMPAAAIVDKKGKKLLSWRVQILPYIEQDNLYKQFKLDEPWDSDNNKKLIPLMPRIYQDPRQPPGEPGQTYYKVFVGKTGGFDWIKGRSFAGITDGTSNTIMVAGGGDPVIWSKPDDFEFDYDKPLPDIRKPFPVLIVAMFDGSVRVIAPNVPEKTLKDMINPADGNVINLP